MDIKSFFYNTKNKIVSFIHDFEEDERVRNRVLIIFLLFIGVCSVFVGLSKTKNNMKAPFYDAEADAISSVYDTYNKLKNEGKIKDETVNTPINSAISNNGSNVSYSKDVDTDSDGISDYDEANIFKTSPYLIDSDGDGLVDAKEISAGTDPNCPTGKDCSIDTSTSNNSNDITGDSGMLTTPTTTTNNDSNTQYNNIDVSKIDITAARKELAGMVPESLKPMLDGMTDDQIRSLLSQLYSSTNGSTNSAQSTNSGSTTSSGSDYKAVLKSKLPKFSASQLATISEMTEADIKKLLLDSNIADATLLSKFKTGELKSTVLGE